MKVRNGLFLILAFSLFTLYGCFPKKQPLNYTLTIGDKNLSFEWVIQNVSYRTTTTYDTLDITDSTVSTGSYTHYEEIIITDTTSIPPAEQHIFNSRHGHIDIIFTNDSFFKRQILIDKDSVGFLKKIGFKCRDTIMSINPSTLEEEMYIDTTRNTIYLLHNLGSMSREQVKETLSKQLYLENTSGRINIDTLDIECFYDSTFSSIQLTYPHPDKDQINKITQLPKGAGIIIDGFAVSNPTLSITRYRLSALITLE